jgi:hypothetical protein
MGHARTHAHKMAILQVYLLSFLGQKGAKNYKHGYGAKFQIYIWLADASSRSAYFISLFIYIN